MTSLARRISKGVFVGLDKVVPPLRGPRVLIYHQIGGGSGLEMEVTADAFRHHLDWLADHASVVSLHAALEDRNNPDSAVITFDDGYRSVFDIAYPLLVERSMPFTIYVTTEPVETGRPMRDHPGSEPLDWEMLRKMAGSGLATIGAHTHTHPDLRMVDETTLERELARSDEIITERMGQRPEHFAYPWGYWSEPADRLIRKRYRTASLGSPRPRQDELDDHLFHRLPVQLSDNTRWFGPRVRGGLRFEESLRRRLRGYRGP